MAHDQRLIRQSDRARRLGYLDWLIERGPGAVFLRVFAQLFRIITGRPLYHYSQITSQLYVGGQHRAHGWASMQARGITAVLNLRREWDDAAKGIAPEQYLQLPTKDNTPPSLDDLREGVRFIQEQIDTGGSVYVHCGVGVGRAPTMAAAYLVTLGMTPEEAWRHIRRVRPFIWPLRGQVRQVQQFAAEHLERMNASPVAD